MITGVLVDIDGTLLASNDAHANAWVDAFKNYGYKIKFDDVRFLIGMGGDKLMKELIPNSDITKEIAEKISKERSKIFLNKYAIGLKPTNGSRALIQKLVDQNFAVIVATSANEEELHTLLKAAHVDDLIKDYTTANDVEESKPAPDIIQTALKKINRKPNEVYMIGDTPYDIEAAKKSDVETIAVRSGGFPDKMLRTAKFIYDDPQQIVTNFEKIFD